MGVAMDGFVGQLPCAHGGSTRIEGAQDPAHADLGFFDDACSADLRLLANIAGSSSRDSLGTAPPTPASVCVGSPAQYSSPPAASSPAATCGAAGSAGAGQGSTAAPHAAEIVRMVFPLLGDRFHGAAARLLEGPWRAAHRALADCATSKLQLGSLPNVGSSAVVHHYCPTASAEVKDLMYALVSLAVDFQTNAPQTPSSTDLLMCMRVKRAPKDSDDASLAVYNVVHRVLMMLRLQCFCKPGSDKPDVHQQGQASMSHLFHEALVRRAAVLKKPPTLFHEDALVMSVIQSMKGGAGQPVWGTKGKTKGAIDPFLGGLLNQLSEGGREVSFNLVQGARMVAINYASYLASANLTDTELVLLTLLQQDGSDLGVGQLRSPARDLVLPGGDANSVVRARMCKKKVIVQAGSTDARRAPLAVLSQNNGGVGGRGAGSAQFEDVRETADGSQLLSVELLCFSLMGDTMCFVISFKRPPWLEYQEQLTIMQRWDGKVSIRLEGKQGATLSRLPGLDEHPDLAWAKRFAKNNDVSVDMPPASADLPVPPLTLLVELGERGCALARVGAVVAAGELEREVKVDADKVKVMVRRA